MVRRHLLTDDSSNIEAVGYDQSTSVLEIVFRSSTDSIYRYENVMPSHFLEMVNATSVGGYFMQHLRHTKFSKVDRYPVV